MKIKTISTLVSIAALTAVTNMASAAGTAAGTDIDNTATITYAVSGVGQAPIGSSLGGNTVGAGTPTTFKVDKKVDLIVTTTSGTNVVPGSPAGATTALTFNLKNEGNSTESFNAAATQVTGDAFDTSACTIASPVLPVSLAAEADVNVVVQCVIPPSSAAVTDGATSDIDLLATTVGVTETAGAEDAATVDVVFADSAGTTTDGSTRNAKHSAVNTYTINTADIEVTKTSVVISDPENGAVFPKRIPGAVIEYTITVVNAASAEDATGLVITDVVPATMSVTACTVAGVGGVTCLNTGGTVTTSSFTLPGGSTETLTITATVL